MQKEKKKRGDVKQYRDTVFADVDPIVANKSIKKPKRFRNNKCVHENQKNIWFKSN